MSPCFRPGVKLYGGLPSVQRRFDKECVDSPKIILEVKFVGFALRS
jgi:hypothetical protein